MKNLNSSVSQIELKLASPHTLPIVLVSVMANVCGGSPTFEGLKVKSGALS